jgi:hypothetical protein
VHALRRIHDALVAGSLVLDPQPLSPLPPVVGADGEVVGRLDMTAWAATIAAVDERVAEVVAEGRFVVEGERRYVVTDRYDDGAAFSDIVRDWQGTTLTPELERAARAAPAPILLHQDVRLRVLRAI